MSEKQRFELRIEGMTCSGCAKTVKTLLEKRGFEVKSINYKDGKTIIYGNPNNISTAQGLIDKAGYRVADIKVLD